MGSGVGSAVTTPQLVVWLFTEVNKQPGAHGAGFYKQHLLHRPTVDAFDSQVWRVEFHWNLAAASSADSSDMPLRRIQASP